MNKYLHIVNYQYEDDTYMLHYISYEKDRWTINYTQLLYLFCY